MTPPVTVTRIGEGAYLVRHDDRQEIVYLAGAAAARWIFWNGLVFHGDFRTGLSPASAAAAPTHRSQPAHTSIVAPMPARVGSVNVTPGSRVMKGDTLVVLEAMKMELPLRAPSDAVVAAVHCRQGELVQAETVLLELQ